MRCPGPLGSCSPVCPLGVLLCVCGVLGHLASVHRCARSVCCTLGCACGIVCSGRRCGALARPSGRRLFVAGRGWVPSGRALIHCAPGSTGWLRGARGGRPRTGLIVPAARTRRGRGAVLAPRRTRSEPRDKVVPCGFLQRRPWAVCVGWRVWSSGVLRGRRHLPLRVGGRHARVPVRVCVCSSVLAGLGRPASRAHSGAPHLFFWPLCLSALLGPLQAGVAPFLVLFFPYPPPFLLFFYSPIRAPVVSGFLWLPAPAALGLGAVFFSFSSRFSAILACFVSPAWLLAATWWLLTPSPPPSLCLAVVVAAARCLVFFSSSCVRPRCLWLFLISGSRYPGPWRRVLFFFSASRCAAFRALSLPLCVLPGRRLLSGGCCPPHPFVPRCFCGPRSVLRSVFFFGLLRPCCLWPPLVSGPGCPATWRYAFFLPPASRLFPPILCLLLGRWLLPGGCCHPPPPLVCLAFFVAAARCLIFFFIFLCAPPLSLAFSGFRPRVPWA